MLHLHPRTFSGSILIKAYSLSENELETISRSIEHTVIISVCFHIL